MLPPCTPQPPLDAQAHLLALAFVRHAELAVCIWREADGWGEQAVAATAQCYKLCWRYKRRGRRRRTGFAPWWHSCPARDALAQRRGATTCGAQSEDWRGGGHKRVRFSCIDWKPALSGAELAIGNCRKMLAALHQCQLLFADRTPAKDACLAAARSA